ncbi:unnamed protein product [Nyctereutes procyonoides]|uniref:(raccoon dog) hypothetical protein n=1 Tax=Nyctereutes procyonoides TaxID=34880 RepID=A0A811Y0F1_NYCPR|nr:unnamed protein product [Nyctereutes procyonoides]
MHPWGPPCPQLGHPQSSSLPASGSAAWRRICGWPVAQGWSGAPPPWSLGSLGCWWLCCFRQPLLAATGAERTNK